MRIEKPSNDNGESRGLDNIIVRGKGGRVMTLDQLLKSDPDAHKEIRVSKIRKGDMIIAKTEGGRTIKIKFIEGRLQGLGLSNDFAPTRSWEVEITGLSEIAVTRIATFVGSGFGGSMISPGVFATDRHLEFYSHEGGKFSIPIVEKISLIRNINEGGEKVYSVVEDSEPAGDLEEKHNIRLENYTSLIKKFGFDKIHDPLNGDERLEKEGVFEDETLIATFKAGMATGNSLIIYNKKTGDYVYYKYFNYKKEDTLQVCYSNLAGFDYDPRGFLNSVNLESETVHRAGAGILTYTTSPSSNIDTINYKTSEGEARTLGVKPYSQNNIAKPDIVILDEGEIDIPLTYPLSLNLENDPNLIQNLKRNTSVIKSEGRVSINLAGKVVDLISPEEVFKKVFSRA